MTGGEGEDDFAVGRIEFETGESAFGESGAGLDVVVGLGAFADVVKKESEVKKIGLFEFVEEFGVALIPFGLRLAEEMEIFDGDEGVLVDGVAMGVVADDESIDGFEFGKQDGEKAKGVEGAERVCGMRREENFLEDHPEMDAAGSLGGDGGQSLLDLMFGDGAEAKAVAGHETKGAKKHFGVVKFFGLAEEDEIADDGEFGVGEARAEMLKLAIEGMALGGDVFEKLGADAVDGASMAEVHAHPV
jgi:hypothetical protein